MRQLHADLWVHEDDLDPMLRMTIVRRRDGDLWVHSPTPLSQKVESEVNSLGKVSEIVAPNNHHHRSLLEWARAFPDASIFLARGLPAKLPGLSDYRLIEEAAANVWTDDLEVAVMSGVSLFDECVFFHPASRSLIVTDLVQNYAGSSRPTGLMYHLIFKPLGYKGTIVAPPLRFDWVVEDRSALERFITTVESWPFSRIIVTHGDVIESDAKTVFSEICDQRFNEKGSRLNAFAMKQFMRVFGS
jgi:hypothetical protein